MGYQWTEEATEEYRNEEPEEQYEDRDEEMERRRRERRHRQMEEMRRRKQRQKQMRRILGMILPVAGVILLFFIFRGLGKEKEQNVILDNQPANYIEETETENRAAESMVAENITTEIEQSVSEEVNQNNGALPKDNHMVYTAERTEKTAPPAEDVDSKYVILIDVEEGKILAERASKTRMIPASMTKVLTVLVAAEHVTDLDDTFTITPEITDFCFVNDCSNVGFEKNETVTVRDLFYGTVLPSGADAALGLAAYVAGSQEAFVKMMNDKLEELGLSDTAHFTNCIGLYDENHYCTVYDMAMIMKAAMDNEICREVLSAKTYNTSSTEQHPEGMLLSNWFLRKIEDKDAGGEVIGGKTGYVVQSHNCAVSLARDADGKEYICVTGDAYSGWRCIYDHVELYKKYMTAE